jgi:hypothetical protein
VAAGFFNAEVFIAEVLPKFFLPWVFPESSTGTRKAQARYVSTAPQSGALAVATV